jgi:RNA polymerase sigma-70 factor, ECF subfamily
MNQDQEDKLIIKKLKKNDVLSFDYLFKKYNKKVYFFAKSYVKNKEDADDVVQEVFFNLWKYRGRINENYIFSKYLFKITYNATCKKFRKQVSVKKQMEEVLKKAIKEDNSTDLEIEYNNLLETANLLIQRLPSRQREIFLLSTNENLTSEQIATQMNISKKSVDNYLGMVKTFLRKSIYNLHILPILFLLFLK